jgi:hypothetical protein
MANSPTFDLDGYTPRRTDGKARAWRKIVGWKQSQAGANPANNPARTDTIVQSKRKFEKGLTNG